MHELHVHFLLQRPRLLVARLADLVMAASSPVSDTFAHNTSADGEAPMLRPRKRSPTIEAAMNNWQTASNTALSTGISTCVPSMHIPSIQSALETIALLVRHCSTSHEPPGAASDAAHELFFPPLTLLPTVPDNEMSRLSINMNGKRGRDMAGPRAGAPALDEVSRRCICHANLYVKQARCRPTRSPFHVIALA